MSGNADQVPIMLFWGGEIVSYGDHKSVNYSLPSKAMCFLSRSSRLDELMEEVQTAMSTSEDNTKLTLSGRYPSTIPGGQVIFVSVPLTNNQSWQWFLETTSLFQPLHVYVIAEKKINGPRVEENQRVVQGGPFLKRCANDNTLYGKSKDRASVVDDGRARKIQRVLQSHTPRKHITRNASSSHAGEEALNGGNAAATTAGVWKKQLTQNYWRVLERVKHFKIDNAKSLAAFAEMAYGKAVTKPAYCEILVDICRQLDHILPKYYINNKVLSFTSCLSYRCQKELERGKGDIDSSSENKWERKDSKLGNVKLIGELYTKKLLQEGIVHSCIKKILREYENPDEEEIEALCKMMYRVGEAMDSPGVEKQTKDMDMYFEEMSKLSKNPDLSSKLKQILVDLVDLRKNKWQPKSAHSSHLSLKIIGNVNLTLEVKLSDTMYNIKSMIKAKEGFLVCKQQLFYSGRLLEDHHTVAYYNLQDNCTLNVNALPLEG